MPESVEFFYEILKSFALDNINEFGDFIPKISNASNNINEV